jgi:hypothetical protein
MQTHGKQAWLGFVHCSIRAVSSLQVMADKQKK